MRTAGSRQIGLRVGAHVLSVTLITSRGSLDTQVEIFKASSELHAPSVAHGSVGLKRNALLTHTIHD